MSLVTKPSRTGAGPRGDGTDPLRRLRLRVALVAAAWGMLATLAALLFVSSTVFGDDGAVRRELTAELGLDGGESARGGLGRGALRRVLGDDLLGEEVLDRPLARVQESYRQRALVAAVSASIAVGAASGLGGWWYAGRALGRAAPPSRTRATRSGRRR